MTILELNGRFPPDADLDAAWRRGTAGSWTEDFASRSRGTPLRVRVDESERAVVGGTRSSRRPRRRSRSARTAWR